MRMRVLFTVIIVFFVFFVGACDNVESVKREPYYRTISGNNIDGSGERQETWGYKYEVPDNKLLVIETISVRLAVTEGQNVVYVEMRYNWNDKGNMLERFHIPVFFQAYRPSVPGITPYPLKHAIFVGSQPVRLYVTPPRFEIHFLKDSNVGMAFATASVSGYLIPKDSLILSP